jgi:hypothetical protein
LRLRYEWNGGRNYGYGGALNRAVRQAKYERIVYLCTNHGSMNDPTWLDDILAPLEDPSVAMAGSVLPCLYACFGEAGRGIHVQGGVFAARTEALRRHPHSPRYPHLASDIWVSRELLRAGYTLADVPSVASRWSEKVSDREKRKIVHEGGC